MPDTEKINQIASSIVCGFLAGLFAVRLYAAIRPRYGAGPQTAVVAALAVWALGYLVNAIPAMAVHMFPRRLLAYGLAAGLVEVVAGAVFGAWLYKEAGSSDAASVA